MSELLIMRALPNPAAKDRTPSNQVTNEQLNGEWVEFRNETSKALDIDGVTMSHYTFTGQCQHTGENEVTRFNGVVSPAHSIRLHTGIGTPWNEGAIRHLYLNRRNFVWNNRCADTAVLRSVRGSVIDYASYARQPPEDAVLNRVPGTHRLAAVPTTATGTYGRY